MEQFIQDLIKEAGGVVLEMFGKIGVKYTKADSTDVVTEADLASNKIIVDSILAKYPEHGIVSEEIPEEEWRKETHKEYVWIIDPLDGTRNFSCHVPLFGLIIALVHNGDVELAAVYLPVTDELYFAKKEGGAFLNGVPIHCAAQDTLKETFGAVWGDLVVGESYRIMQELIDRGRLERYWFGGLACMAASLSYVAAGRRDWYVGPAGMGVWDVAAPFLILQESGCRVSDLSGGPFKIWESKHIIAANSALHEELRLLLNP